MVISPTRNQLCPCGSGLRFKNCCGKLSDESTSFFPPMPFMDVCSINRHCEGNDSAFGRKIIDLLRKGNFPLAETLLRISLERDPTNPETLNFLGWIASAVNIPQFAISYF